MGNSTVSMVLMNKGKSILLDDVTDSIGRFEFNDIVFNGSSVMMLNSQNEKGKNRGLFRLDSVHNSPTKTNYTPILSGSLKTKTIKENIYKKYINYWCSNR